MKYLTINGRREKVPPFPHHKDYLYQCKQFFGAKSLMNHLTMNRFYTVKEFIRSIKHKCMIPRVLLLDPTSACNLNCEGCWARDYGRNHNLTYEKLDDILTQAEKLGIECCFFSGGEPLMRKEDILKLAKKHSKMTFGAYTNGTLIDEKFADEIMVLGNVNMFVSIEGFDEATDFRRGEGVYLRAIKAMELLKERNIGFGFSACYHSENYKVVASEDFLNFMREKGAWFGWLFQFMPVGNDADVNLSCSPEQRAYVQEKVSKYSVENDYLLIDFWNNGHLAFGCVAAGNGFVHINAKGDVEPCAFCHFSDSNIYEKTLLECLKSPFFMKFRSNQPFSENPLRACPLIDVPEGLVSVTCDQTVKSTHYSSPEDSASFYAKTIDISKNWKPVADKIYKSMPALNQTNFPKYLSYFRLKRKLSDERLNKR